jgi:formate dehydrogenase subunit gamma
MVATTSRSEFAPAAPVRFDVVERVVHWSQATLFFVLFATAAALYVDGIAAAVGRRQLVESIHVWAGLALPLPLISGVVLRRRGARLRLDIRRLNRWLPDDFRWLRSRGRAAGLQLGKFNAGQKLNAAFTLGAIGVMLATGAVMRWFQLFPLPWRTGATAVHDWLAIAIVVVVTGHVWFAVRDRRT